MKNFKKILFGLIFVSVAMIGITACSDDVPDGDNLENALEEDYTWLLGTWDRSTTYEASGNIDAMEKYIPEDTSDTITITEADLEARRDELLNLINHDELFDKINKKLADVASAKLKASNTYVVSEDRTKVTIYRKYKASAMLILSAKATVTITWEKQ